MAWVNACTEQDDLGGGRFRSIIGLRPTAYLVDGIYQRAVHDWTDNGGAAHAHLVTRAPLMCGVTVDGMRRFYPLRDDSAYIEFAPPQYYDGEKWQPLEVSTAQSATPGTYSGQVEIDWGAGVIERTDAFAFEIRPKV